MDAVGDESCDVMGRDKGGGGDKWRKWVRSDEMWNGSMNGGDEWTRRMKSDVM